MARYKSPSKNEQPKPPSSTKRRAAGRCPTVSPDKLRQTTLMTFYNISAPKRARLDLAALDSSATPSKTSPTSPEERQLERDGRRLVPLVKRLRPADIVALQQDLLNRSAASNDRDSSVLSTASTSSTVCSTIISNLRDIQRLASVRTRHKSSAAAAAAAASASAAAATAKQQQKRGNASSAAAADDEYAVENVLKINEISGEPHFLVKWQGWAAANNTWEPLAHVRHCDSFKRFIAKQTLLFQSEIEQIAIDCAEQHTDAKSAATEAAPVTRRSDDNANDRTNDARILAGISDFDECRVQSQLLLVALWQRNDECRGTRYKRLMASLKRDLARLPDHLRRMQQLDALRAFEQQINAIDKSANLSVENLVDFEGPPVDFVYVNERFAGTGVHIPDDPIIGCDCTGGDAATCSSRSQCCAQNSHSQFAYNNRNAIRVPRGTPIFECNRRCSCGPECRNRVVQKGRKHSLCIYKTANGCGWGVRTLRTIAQGQFICEYVGEVLTYEETEQRGRVYDAAGRTYLFDLDMNSNDNPYTIDAAHHGNVSHFINHSCDPNSGVWAVWIDCMDLDLPRIALFALRRIEAGEPLSFDYMSGARPEADAETAPNATDGAGADSERNKMQMECKCGSANCRKSVF